MTASIPTHARPSEAPEDTAQDRRKVWSGRCAGLWRLRGTLMTKHPRSADHVSRKVGAKRFAAQASAGSGTALPTIDAQVTGKAGNRPRNPEHVRSLLARIPPRPIFTTFSNSGDEKMTILISQHAECFISMNAYYKRGENYETCVRVVCRGTKYHEAELASQDTVHTSSWARQQS